MLFASNCLVHLPVTYLNLRLCMQLSFHVQLLACFIGSIPEGLVPLTRIEENLLSRYRVHRNLYVMKPATMSYSAAGTLQLCHQAHVIATPNTGPNMVRDCLLAHPDSLEETLDVVFMVLVDSDDPAVIEASIKTMVDRSPSLRIRGKEVLKWAMHLSKVGGSAIAICH